MTQLRLRTEKGMLTSACLAVSMFAASVPTAADVEEAAHDSNVCGLHCPVTVQTPPPVRLSDDHREHPTPLFFPETPPAITASTTAATFSGTGSFFADAQVFHST